MEKCRPLCLPFSPTFHLNSKATSCYPPIFWLKELWNDPWGYKIRTVQGLPLRHRNCLRLLFLWFPHPVPSTKKMSPQNPVVKVSHRAEADRTNCWQVLLIPGFEKWVWFTTGLLRPIFMAAGNHPYTGRQTFRPGDVTALLNSKRKKVIYIVFETAKSHSN